MVIEPPKIGVVIVNYDGAEDTLRCLESLRAAPGGRRRTWVVDNASTDGSAERIPPALGPDEVWLPTGANLGFGGGANAGIREALAWGAEYVLVLNNDLTVDGGFLPPLVRALEAVPRAGVACALTLDRDTGRIQSLGGDFSLWTGRARRRLHGAGPDDGGTATWSVVDFPMGDCMLFKRAFFEEAGLMHEAYFLYYEDVEVGLRARREGWKSLAIPHSRVFHRDSTAGGERSPVVSFYGTRNQAWVVAQYGRPLQRLTFLALSALLRWPWKVLSRLLHGRARAAWAVLRGSLSGLSDTSWRDERHLAVPVAGRSRKTVLLEEL